MTHIFINGFQALIKSGSVFEFCAENSNFSNSEGYSLAIEFPLRDCLENVRIFGHINRDDVAKGTSLMKAEIVSGRFRKSGALAVMDVSEKSVKGQFLEGLDPDHEELPIDKLFMNELDLGEYPQSDPKRISPSEARAGTGKEVCLPWVPIGYDVVNCHAISSTQWHEETTRLSWQPYLMPIVIKTAELAGYSPQLSNLESSKWKDAIICNTLPPNWEMPKYAHALPRWTVREFFEKLGLFLQGSFEFDETQKTVSFNFWKDSANLIQQVELKDIADEYTSTVSRDEEDADYLPIKRYRYKDQSLPVWKYLSAPWIHSGGWVISRFRDLEEYRNAVKPDASGHRGSVGQFIYLEDVDTHFVFRRVQIYSKGHVDDDVAVKYPYASYFELQPVDVFSPPDYDKEDNYEDLDFNPVMVDYALEGKMMFLPVTPTDDEQYMDNEDISLDFGNSVTLKNGVKLADRLTTSQTRIEHAVESHEDDDGQNEYFSEIYIGFMPTHPELRPYPLTDVDVYAQEIQSTTKFMRLSEGGAGGIRIDPKVKYSFSFLADSIPDIKARFLIHGQLYVAQKITATFSEYGMSSLLKGEFFRIIDNY